MDTHVSFFPHSATEQAKQFLCQTARSALILSIWNTCLLHSLHSCDAPASFSEATYKSTRWAYAMMLEIDFKSPEAGWSPPPIQNRDLSNFFGNFGTIYRRD